MNKILTTGVLVTAGETYQLTLYRESLVFQPCAVFRSARVQNGRLTFSIQTAVDVTTLPQSVGMTHTSPQSLWRRGVWNVAELRKVLPIKVEQAYIFTPMDTAMAKAGAS